MARSPAYRTSQWDQWGLRPRRGVISLLVLLTALYFIFKFGPPPVQEFYRHLILQPRLALTREPWQLLTGGFMVFGLRNIFYIGVTLIFFGNVVEQMRGARGLWLLYIAGELGGGLFTSLAALPLRPYDLIPSGGGAGIAILVAYAVLMSGRDVMAFGVARMRGGTIAWIWVAIAVIGCLLDAVEGKWVSALLELAGMAGAALAGWLYIRRGGGIGNMRGSIDRFRMWRLRRRYRVLSGGRDDKRYLN